MKGLSEPETQVIEYLTWRLDIYDDYPQDKYLEDYQNGFIRDNWPEMYVTAPDGDFIRNYRTEAHDMKHNFMNSVCTIHARPLHLAMGLQGPRPSS